MKTFLDKVYNKTLKEKEKQFKEDVKVAKKYIKENSMLIIEEKFSQLFLEGTDIYTFQWEEVFGNELKIEHVQVAGHKIFTKNRLTLFRHFGEYNKFSLIYNLPEGRRGKNFYGYVCGY